MPDRFDALFAVAEVGIALAGFSGVVAVLGRRSAGEWSDPDWLRFAMLLAFTFAAVLFSLLPVLLLALGASEAAAWAVASLLLALFLLAARVLVLRRLAALGESARRQFPPAAGRAVAILSAPVVLVLLLNGTGLLFGPAFGPFFLGMLWLLALGGFQDFRLLRLG